MSKLLKAAIKNHRPHIAARLTKENGYDERKHLHASDLHEAGFIDGAELADLQGCVDDLASSGSNTARALKAAMSGELSADKMNDDAFIKALMALDSDVGGDDGDDLDEPIDTDEKVTA